MRRPSLALALIQRAQAESDCAAETEIACEKSTAHVRRAWARRRAANPANLALMAKRKAASKKRQRRPRAEIDRNFFLGDVFIKTGVAVMFALAAILLYAPGNVQRALSAHDYTYPILIGLFAAAGVVAYVFGLRLRHEATQWEVD